MDSIQGSYSIQMGAQSITPPSSSVTSPCSTEVLVPVVDMVFESLDEGESFYYAYANSVGFDVRKAQHEKEGDVVLWKLYVCNKEGKRRSPKSDVKYKKKVVRVNCPACIKLKRMDNGHYIVENFEEAHSHGLATPSKRKFLKGSRNVNDRIKRTLATCSKVNIGVAQSFHLVKEQVGGYENIGCIQNDLSNFQQELRTLVQDSDAQILLDKFNSMKMRDPGFNRKEIFDQDGIILSLHPPLLSNTLRTKVFNLYAKFDQCINMICQDNVKLDALDKLISDFKMLEVFVGDESLASYDLVENIGSSVPDKIEVHPPKRSRMKGAPTKRLKPTWEKLLHSRNKCSACGMRS